MWRFWPKKDGSCQIVTKLTKDLMHVGHAYSRRGALLNQQSQKKSNRAAAEHQANKENLDRINPNKITLKFIPASNSALTLNSKPSTLNPQP
jgi:hypothetical protein